MAEPRLIQHFQELAWDPGFTQRYREMILPKMLETRFFIETSFKHLNESSRKIFAHQPRSWDSELNEDRITLELDQKLEWFKIVVMEAWQKAMEKPYLEMSELMKKPAQQEKEIPGPTESKVEHAESFFDSSLVVRKHKADSGVAATTLNEFASAYAYAQYSAPMEFDDHTVLLADTYHPSNATDKLLDMEFYNYYQKPKTAESLQTTLDMTATQRSQTKGSMLLREETPFVGSRQINSGLFQTDSAFCYVLIRGISTQLPPVDIFRKLLNLPGLVIVKNADSPGWDFVFGQNLSQEPVTVKCKLEYNGQHIQAIECVISPPIMSEHEELGSRFYDAIQSIQENSLHLRPPEVIFLRGNRLSKGLQETVQFSDEEFKDMPKFLNRNLKIVQANVICPKLYNENTKFSQISSVSEFHTKEWSPGKPSLLLSSSSHIAVLKEGKPSEFHIFDEPVQPESSSATGIRAAKMFAGRIVVFRVDMVPMIYTPSTSNWTLNLFQTLTQCRFLGRAFCNVWNATDRGIRLVGEELHYLGYLEKDVKRHPNRKYPEIMARLVTLRQKPTSYEIEEIVGGVSGIEDFMVEGSGVEQSFVILRQDGHVMRLTDNWIKVSGQEYLLQNADGISLWSSLGKLGNCYVAAGYMNRKDKTSVFYYLLNENIQLTGGVGLEVQLKKFSNLAPPVINMITKTLQVKKCNHQREEVHLLLAVLASGELNLLSSAPDKGLFLVQRLTGNESLNSCAVSICQIGEDIYSAGQMYLTKLSLII